MNLSSADMDDSHSPEDVVVVDFASSSKLEAQQESDDGDSDDDYCSDDDRSSCDSGGVQRQEHFAVVSFGDVTVRQFPATIGNSPSVSCGVPIALDYDARREDGNNASVLTVSTMTVDLYESARRMRDRLRGDGGKSAGTRRLFIDKATREEILLARGYSEADIAAAKREVKKTRSRRAVSPRSRKVDGVLPSDRFQMLRRASRQQLRNQQTEALDSMAAALLDQDDSDDNESTAAASSASARRRRKRRDSDSRWSTSDCSSEDGDLDGERRKRAGEAPRLPGRRSSVAYDGHGDNGDGANDRDASNSTLPTVDNEGGGSTSDANANSSNASPALTRRLSLLFTSACPSDRPPKPIGRRLSLLGGGSISTSTASPTTARRGSMFGGLQQQSEAQSFHHRSASIGFPLPPGQGSGSSKTPMPFHKDKRKRRWSVLFPMKRGSIATGA